MPLRPQLVVACGLFGLAALSGCSKTETSSADPPANSPVPTLVESHSPAELHQSFEEATTEQAPAGANRPEERTLAGLSTAKLRQQVQDVWPSIRLTDDAGKPAPIAVVVETEAGRMEMELYPEVAPNHVRNFLALAKVCFYDGLVFERTIRQEVVSEGSAEGRWDTITGGCPYGHGEVGAGHVGYFLKPENSPLSHQEGTVGFWRDDDPNSAGTRFYITLAAAPFLNAHFTAIGRVTNGLDVARAIAKRPVKDPNSYPESEQPKEPVKILRVVRK